MDKKRVSKMMNFILLSRTGKGVIVPIPVDQLKNYLNQFNALK
jgi:3-dehydroquinate synthetase